MKKDSMSSMDKSVERPVVNSESSEQKPDGSPAVITLDETKIDKALEKFYANRDEAMIEFERQQEEDISDLVRALNEASE